jgi:hypothetical protein
MCCPFFDPVQPRHGTPSRDAMLPLGDRWVGLCRAIPEASLTAGSQAEAGENSSRPLCNLGYARGECRRFPGGDAPDAVRFTVSRDDGAVLRLSYVVERGHQPFANGSLHFSRALAAFTAPPPGEILLNQARAYVACYLRRSAAQDG